jgi:hypothetical protein
VLGLGHERECDSEGFNRSEFHMPILVMVCGNGYVICAF